MRWSRWRTEAWVLVAVLLVVLLGSCHGLHLTSSHREGPDVTVTPPRPTRSPAPTDPAGPTLVTWGFTNHLLAAMVRNDGHRTLRSAHVRIDVFDPNGMRIYTSPPDLESKCCQLHNLPVGARAGLFLDLHALRPRVGKVVLSYEQPVWAPAGAPVFHVQVSRARLVHLRGGDVEVRAALRVEGTQIPYAAAQAFLTGPRHGLVAVISARVYCFRPGVWHAIRMSFTHPVPRGTTLQGVVAYPLPASAVPASVPACRR